MWTKNKKTKTHTIFPKKIFGGLGAWNEETKENRHRHLGDAFVAEIRRLAVSVWPGGE